MALCGDAARVLIYNPADPEDEADIDGGLPACANHLMIMLAALATTGPDVLKIRVLAPMNRTKGGSLTAESRRRRIPCEHRQPDTSMRRRFDNRPPKKTSAEPADAETDSYPATFPTDDQ